jgi:uncharacterized YigZ family protein
LFISDAGFKQSVTLETTKFKTILNPSEGTYKEKGSKFLAFAFPVSTEEDIKDRLSQIKRKYHDARHHCFAYRMGFDLNNFRAFDDGEPNHSAGDPILGQIKSYQLTNILIVVVRYFGGVKLGVGGLISAYKLAAQDALSQATIIEKTVMASISISYSYEATTETQKLIHDFNASILKQEFKTNCNMTIEFDAVLLDQIRNKIELLKTLGHDIHIVD